MTRKDLLARIDSDELTGWMAFDRIHVSRTDGLLAQLCSLIHDAHRDPKKSRHLPADHFLGRKRTRDPRAVERQLKAWAGMMGARKKT